MEIVGRHHDPFTVMEQFGARSRIGMYSQPVTDFDRRAARAPAQAPSPHTTGWSFSAFRCRPLPRTCWRVIWRSRRRARPSPRSPTRSPRSIWRTPPITRTSRRRSGCRCTCSRCGGASTTPRRQPSACLGAATIGVTLSNFYGGFIAAVITPVAVAAYWLTGSGRPDVASGIDARLARHRRRVSRSSRPAGSLRGVRRPRRRLEPRGLRVPSRRSVRLQRGLVELSGSAGRASAGRRHRASLLDCRGRPRGPARTAGEPRLGNRRARLLRRPWLLCSPQSREAPASICPVCSRAGPRHRRRRRAGVLAVAGADDRAVHLRPAFGAAVRRGADVPGVRAVRGRRAADGGAAGGHRGGLSPPGRDQARADRVRRARGARRRRVRRLAVGAVARCAADDGASLGDAAARWRAGPRLHAAQPGVRIGSVADAPSRELAARRLRDRAADADCTDAHLPGRSPPTATPTCSSGRQCLPAPQRRDRLPTARRRRDCGSPRGRRWARVCGRGGREPATATGEQP